MDLTRLSQSTLLPTQTTPYEANGSKCTWYYVPYPRIRCSFGSLSGVVDRITRLSLHLLWVWSTTGCSYSDDQTCQSLDHIASRCWWPLLDERSDPSVWQAWRMVPIGCWATATTMECCLEAWHTCCMRDWDKYSANAPHCGLDTHWRCLVLIPSRSYLVDPRHPQIKMSLLPDS